MNKILKLLSNLYFLNLKTIYFNFKYLPIKKAIKFPILISKYTYLKKVSGRIDIINDNIYTGMIRIGKEGVGIFDEKKSRSIWEVSGKVVFEGKCIIGQGGKISVGKDGQLTFGENFVMTAESSIVCTKMISFGINCLMSWDILIMDTDFHKIKNKNGEIINPTQDVTIGNNVWIGCRATILKGSEIPNDCVIGANTLLNKPLNQSNTVYAGSPIRIAKENITWTE